MGSPFVYETPVDARRLIDRADELDTLMDRIHDGRSSRIEGPRRYGKTSLVRAALAQARNDGLIAIEVNFMGCITAAQVAERIERAYSRQLDSRLRQWFTGLVRTWRPTITAAPGGVGASVSPQASDAALLDRLALPRRVQERTGRACVVAFDEFQEVMKASDELAGVFRSELETHDGLASYIFCGSHPGLMRELFAHRGAAFFGQASPVPLGTLPLDELGEYVAARFADGNRDPGDGLGPLLDLSAGHPQRAMLLAHHLYQRTAHDTAAGPEVWLEAQDAARSEAQGEIAVMWDDATRVQRRVLKAIADDQVKLASHAATERYDLIRGSTTGAAVAKLIGDGHLVESPGESVSGYRIVDPFLAAWLSES